MPVPSDSLLSRIKIQIETCEIVSFDIFDTLLLRPYIRPTDLFLHLEKMEKMPFFCASRIEAEKNARIKHAKCEDITLDMIYDEIDAAFKPFKQKELTLERQILRVNPEIKEVYEFACSIGKKIVIASDMYLPKDFLADILNKNGFTGWDKLYISGDCNQTKCAGSLYHKMIEDFAPVTPDKILHIGDNKKSDYKKAKNCGLSAVHYLAVAKQFYKQNKRAKVLSKRATNSLGLSILLGITAYNWQIARFNAELSAKSYWQNIGYNYAGPLAYGYSRFVESEAVTKKLDNILFVARDGWLLQKVFSLFNNKIKNSYIYAPRLFNLICRLDYNRKNIKQSQAIVSNFIQHNPEIKSLYDKTHLKSAKDYHNFIQDHISLFAQEASKSFQNYRNYLAQYISATDKIGMVDTITCEFSSQKLIQKSVGNYVNGLYWGILPSQLQWTFEYSTFTKSDATQQSHRNVFTSNWNFIEFLLTSPEYPIKGLSDANQPIYASVQHPSEVWRAETYRDISASAVEFAQDVQNLFKGKDIYLTAADLITWINTFIDYPTKEDVKNMSGVLCAIDSDHTQFVPLFVDNTSFIEFCKHPQYTLKVLKKTLWRTNIQSILAGLFYPISCRIKGLKKIKIALLPCLRKQYFVMALTLADGWFYKFIIGNSEKCEK